MPPQRITPYVNLGDTNRLDNEDRIYVDLNYRADKNNEIAQYNFRTTDYFIHHNISRYGVTVIRFDLQHARLPIWIFQEDEELELFVVLFNNNGEESLKRLVLLPDHPYTDERARYIYSIDQIIKMLNIALEESYTELIGKDATTLGDTPPQFYYDGITNRINYIVDYTMREAQTGNKMTLYFSKALSKYFKHLKFTELIDEEGLFSSLGLKFIPREEPLSSNRVDDSLTYKNNGDYLHMISVYQNTRYFSPIQSIKLAANLNNRGEIKINSDTNISSNENYLTDFIGDIENPIQIAQSELFYFNDTEKRFIDLISSSSLSDINIRFLWTDRRGIDNPIRMDENQIFNIKLLFRKKSKFNV
jgi:hypothetical protein